MSFLTRLLRPSNVAFAHCDGPCGVYDPASARIAAEAVLSMAKKIAALGDGTDAATVAVTVTGVNDAPQTVGAITQQTDDDSLPVTLDVSGFFTDPDATDTLTYSDGGTLPPGLSIDPNTGLISGTLASSASAGGPYAVVITADDGHGGTVTQTFTWVVNNPAPVALDDNYGLDEDAAATVLGNAITDNDSDPDGDALTAVGQSDVVGSNGGLFSLATDGSVTFAPNGDFEDLAVGETRTITVKRRLLCTVIEARVEEIIEEVLRSLRSRGLMDSIFGGVVLTGGSALLEGIQEKARDQLQWDAHIGFPNGVAGYEEIVSSPSYATVIGLLHYGYERRDARAAVYGPGWPGAFRRAWEWLRETF